MNEIVCMSAEDMNSPTQYIRRNHVLSYINMCVCVCVLYFGLGKPRLDQFNLSRVVLSEVLKLFAL